MSHWRLCSGIPDRTVGLLKRSVGILRRTVGLLKRAVGILKRAVGILRRAVGLPSWLNLKNRAFFAFPLRPPFKPFGHLHF